MGVAVSFLAAFLAIKLFMPPFLDLLGRLGWTAANYRQRLLPVPGGLLLVLVWTVLTWLAAPPAEVLTLTLVTIGVAGLGLIDDRYGDARARGLAGHLHQLRQGRFTTGALKALGILLLGLIWARAIFPDWLSQVLAGLIIALAANAFNLLDLVPGRAGKAFVASNALLLLTGPAAGPLLYMALGGTLAYLPFDLREQTMLGDTGANALGFMVGGLLVLFEPRWVQVPVMLALGGMHFYAERASISHLIASRPWLRFLDGLGRIN